MIEGMKICIDHTISRIRAFAVYRGWKKSRLAAEAGINDTTLRHFDDPNWNPTIETLRRLETIIPADFDAAVTPQDFLDQGEDAA